MQEYHTQRVHIVGIWLRKSIIADQITVLEFVLYSSTTSYVLLAIREMRVSWKRHVRIVLGVAMGALAHTLSISPRISQDTVQISNYTACDPLFCTAWLQHGSRRQTTCSSISYAQQPAVLPLGVCGLVVGFVDGAGFQILADDDHFRTIEAKRPLWGSRVSISQGSNTSQTKIKPRRCVQLLAAERLKCLQS